jgi:hypothetical protein
MAPPPAVVRMLLVPLAPVADEPGAGALPAGAGPAAVRESRFWIHPGQAAMSGNDIDEDFFEQEDGGLSDAELEVAVQKSMEDNRKYQEDLAANSRTTRSLWDPFEDQIDIADGIAVGVFSRKLRHCAVHGIDPYKLADLIRANLDRLKAR